MLKKLATNYDGVDGISMSDQPYGEAKEIIMQAFAEGFIHVVVDDSFMMFKQKIPHSSICFDNVEDLLMFAGDEWWL